VLAKADAERMTIQAEAAASYNRVALDRMLIDQLPQIVKEAAAGLANANITVLNGADGLGEIAAGLVGQGLTIFDSVKQGLASSLEAAQAEAGRPPEPEPVRSVPQLQPGANADPDLPPESVGDTAA
jgi:uncharacterized membrane protein YqiK